LVKVPAVAIPGPIPLAATGGTGSIAGGTAYFVRSYILDTAKGNRWWK